MLRGTIEILLTCTLYMLSWTPMVNAQGRSGGERQRSLLGGEPASDYNIVILGDSYASGVGARNKQGNREYEGTPFHSRCGRAPTTWGELYGNLFQEAHPTEYNVKVTNRACQNGTIPDMFSPSLQESSFGRCPRWKEDRPLFLLEDEYYVQERLLQCDLFVPPQVEFVDETTDMVLLMLGGNDAFFVPVVTDCILLRNAMACSERLEAAIEQLLVIKDSLVDVLVEIASRIPESAKVIFVSYPYIVLDVPNVLTDRETGFTIDATAEIYAFGDFGDVIQQQAVDDANALVGRDFALFVTGIKEVFAGHEPDPLYLGFNKDSWMWDVESPYPSEWFHPKQVGYDAIAEVVFQALEMM